jgi:RNA polymerase sigma-70 factor (ECF subfamily)
MQADGEFVRAVVRGDRGAFAALVARHERAVWATAWRVLRDDHAAADAGQEAFLQAFRQLADLRQPERFGPWLLRIARRVSIRMARCRAREPSRSLDDGGIDPPRLGEHLDGSLTGLSTDSEELLLAIGRLPEQERLVVVLRYLNGLPVVEVAAALDRPVGTVTKQLSRAIDRLRTKIKG